MTWNIRGEHFCSRRISGGWGARTGARLTLYFLQPGLETVTLEQRCKRRYILFLCRQIVQDGWQRNIALHRQQITALWQPVQGLAQVLANRAADFSGVRHHRIEAAVLRQPLYRRLRADLVNTGHVIHRIADQGKVIDDQCRRHAEFLRHTGFVEHFVAHGVDQGHALVHQLREILVAGGYDGLDARARRHA